MTRDQLLDQIRAELHALRGTAELRLDSQEVRDAQVHKTEDRIRVVEELRNISLAEAHHRAVG